jgi:hypothetical protein
VTPEKAPQVPSPNQATAQPAQEPAAAVADVVARPADVVRTHLAAGEFGAAYDAALAVDEPAEQSRLLEEVAAAQVASGEFHLAHKTLRRLPAGDARDALARKTAMAQSLSGGSGADPTQLIQLILTETGDLEYGPWQTTHGDGAPDPAFFDSGVRVDPNGLLALVTKQEREARLAQTQQQARAAALNTDLARPAELRMVSLTRLDRAIRSRLEAGKPVVESMRQLAGLSEVQYVFVYPEEREIVIAGPAEGWVYNEHSQAVGAATGRPTLQLDDLVTVLRTFSRDGQNIFGCSIDPRPEGLQALRDFAAASQARGPLAPGQARGWAERLGETLGRQDVTVYGVPADSRVARVIVEADYRMKLIGIGKLDAPSSIPDYFALLSRHPEQASGRIDGLRWWLTLACDEVLHSDSRTAFELRGASVRCLSENELLDASGRRVHTGEAEPTNRLFAANFTQHYDELAQRDPIFADMQGVFNLALAAALIQNDGLDRQIGWDRGVFRSGGEYVAARYPVPREVETVVNHRVFGGRDVVVQVAGGVTADLMKLLKSDDVRRAAPRLEGVAARSRAGELPAGRWWWDAE